MRRREFITLLGSAAAWPLSVRAQPAMPVIGFLSPGSAESDVVRLTGVRQGLKESGYVEGQNVAIEYRFAHGQNDRLPALAADLVDRRVAGIVTAGTPATLAAKAATATVPIVFNTGVDPVQFGLAASLSRPGGNLTGVVILSGDLAAKKLEVLHELLPDAAVVAMLVNPANPVVEPELRATQDAARSLGVQLHILAQAPQERSTQPSRALRSSGLVRWSWAMIPISSTSVPKSWPSRPATRFRRSQDGARSRWPAAL